MVNTVKFQTHNLVFIQAGARYNHFILRHLKDAAQKMQRDSSRLYTVIIDFKLAYDLIPRDKLWDHKISVRCLNILSPLYSNAYHADEYTILDGDKRANVQPSFGVKQRRPLSPLLSSFYLNDVDSQAEGVQGAITGIPNFTVTHLLFADNLSLTSTDHNELQTVLNKLRVYALKKSLTVNTQDLR